MEHKSNARIGQIILWLIVALGVVLFIMIMLGNEAGIDGGLYLTYAVLGIGVVLAVLSGLMSLFTGGNLKSALIPLVALAAMFIVSYVLADGAVKPTWTISESTSKLIGAGLIMTGIAAGVAVAAAIYGGVMKLFK
ncbi:MAG: hypothetical protein KDC00_08220 [Flavobacteriales bacterium]|nr:hypothetical protein [Flavobacteriales bacterium]